MFESFLRLTILFFGCLFILIFFLMIALSLLACPYWMCTGESANAGFLAFFGFLFVLPSSIFLMSLYRVESRVAFFYSSFVALVPIGLIGMPLLEMMNSNDTDAQIMISCASFLSFVFVIFIAKLKKTEKI